MRSQKQIDKRINAALKKMKKCKEGGKLVATFVEESRKKTLLELSNCMGAIGYWSSLIQWEIGDCD